MPSKNMNRQVVWSGWDETQSLDHLVVRSNKEGYAADGLLITADYDEEPLRISYYVNLDKNFRVREVLIENLAPENDKVLHLESDGEGHWQSEGQNLVAFDGCLYIDLSATPFTNSLPIWRLNLANSQHADIEVVYIPAETLQVRRERQRYTRLDATHYLYESLGTNFKAQLTVDEDGLVVEYQGLFSQVWSDE